MKLSELNVQEDVIEPYKIFVDLDGVMVDFSKGAHDFFGMDADQVMKNTQLKKEFWKRVMQRVKNGQPVWGAMDPTPDAHELWAYVAKYHPTILTATGKTAAEQAVKEKNEWIRKHIGPNIPIIFVTEAKDKAEYAAPNHILIDDQQKAIGPWEAKGGVGILHKGAASTIAKLKELGL